MKAKSRFPSHEEMLAMERRWTIVLCTCLLVFAWATLNLLLLAPQGIEETACHVLIPASLVGAVYALVKLRAAMRGDAPDNVEFAPGNPMENAIEFIDD